MRTDALPRRGIFSRGILPRPIALLTALAGTPTAAILAVATAASIALAVSPPSLALDLDVYATLQADSPALLHTLAFDLDVTARVFLFAVIAAALAIDRRRWHEAGVDAARVASGAFVGELLKTIFERLRPSAPLGTTTGNSLPSGHIMNTTLVAVAAWELAEALPRPWRVPARAATIVAVLAQAGARIAHGSHWPSDVLPSVLLGLLWMRIAAPLWSVRRRRVPLVVTGIVTYALFLFCPAVRIHLPSVTDAGRVAVRRQAPALHRRQAPVPRPVEVPVPRTRIPSATRLARTSASSPGSAP